MANGTYSDLQNQIDKLNAAVLNRPTYQQFNDTLDISVGQFGNNTELVTDKRMKAIEARLTIALQAFQSLTNELNELKALSGVYIHTQAIASAVWVIEHNLGFEPDIELIDNNGDVFVASITHDSVNQATVNLGTGITGKARCT